MDVCRSLSISLNRMDVITGTVVEVADDEREALLAFPNKYRREDVLRILVRNHVMMKYKDTCFLFYYPADLNIDLQDTPDRNKEMLKAEARRWYRQYLIDHEDDDRSDRHY